MATEQIKIRFYKKIKNLLPSAGITLFFLLFACSAFLYPGGSQADKQTKGFSWQHNYWCELMNSHSMNGLPNPAQPFAVTGIVCLAVGLSAFFITLPDYCKTAVEERIVLKLCGIVATSCAALLFTRFHDIMLAGFSILTFLTLLTGLVILWNNNHKKFFATGAGLLLLIQLNNAMYYTRYRVEHLPWIQKITIILTLLWILAMNLWFYTHTSNKQKQV
jgi:hypothetical protein